MNFVISGEQTCFLRSMRTLPIETANWIENGILPRITDDFKLKGCTIGNCIPPVFESYCKIFHPFEVTPDKSDVLEPPNTSKQNSTLSFNFYPNTGPQILETHADGTVIDLLERHKEQLADKKTKHWVNASWKSIAEKYGLIYHNEINPHTFRDNFQIIGTPKNLDFPKEGHLPRPLLIQLLEILKKNSLTNEVSIYQALPHTIWKDNKPSDLVQCNYEEVLEYFETDFIGYLYSADKSWIVFTDTDLHFTISGGTKALINTLTFTELEVLKCEATTRVDYNSDKINHTKTVHSNRITIERFMSKLWKKLTSIK